MNLSEWAANLTIHRGAISRIVHTHNTEGARDFDFFSTNPFLFHRKLRKIMNQAWENAPDRPGIHQVPGWSMMCDLLSEHGVGEGWNHD